MMKQKRKRLWALLLSAALIVTQLPAVAMAENTAPEDGSIASFEPLDSGVAKQTVDVGTELSELTLPDTVTATIYHVTEDMVIPDEDNMEDDSGDPSTATPSEAVGSVSDNSSGDSSDKDSGKTVTTVTTSEEEITVTWDSDPAYDGDTAGSYVFTADVGGYALSGGAELPKITVTVATDAAENPTGNPPTEPLPCTKTEGCTLEDGHEGECKTKTAVITVTAFDNLDEAVQFQTVPAGTTLDNLTLPATLGAAGYTATDDTEPAPEPEPITITGVTWEPDSPWDETAEQGGYTFTPVLPAGYALADAVELPEINVLIGAGNRLLAAPQAVYHAGDMAAFQAILTAHPSLVSNGVDKNDPASWATAGLVNWDSSSPKRLGVLFLYDKGLTGTLDVGSLTNLYILSCESNQLEKLEGLGSLTNLVSLHCGNNQLTGTLDVRNLTNLTELHCESNQLEKLEGLGSLTKNLIYLSCHSNQLTGTLDVENLTNLIYLSCHSNQLTGTLDVGNLTNLVSLYCGSNQLEKLEGLGSLTNLNILSCGNNPYTSFTTKDGHTLTVTPATGGKIWLTAFNMSNNEVELTAAPDSGYTFQAWSGLPAGALGDQTTSFILNSNITVLAAFRPFGADATLKSLSLSGATLTPAFDPATTSYTTTVGNAVDKVTVTVEANDPKARVGLFGDWIAASPEPILRLNVGENTLVATVRSENGTHKNTYVVTITREAAAGAATVTIDTIPGVTAPVKGATPVTVIRETTQYTGAVTWNPIPGAVFAPNTEYAATITLTPKTGYTLQGVAADFFKVEGATATNNSDSGTVTAVFPKTAPDGGNSGDNNDNGGDDNEPTRYTITTPQPPKPNNPVLAVIELPVTVGNGTAAGQPDDGRTESAIAEAQRNAKAKTNGIAVQYDAKTTAAYDGFSITIKRATLDRLTADKNKVKWLTLNTGIVDLTFDLAALKEIAANSTGDITLTATRETGLTGDALVAVGSRPAYRLAVSYTGKDGKVATVQSFGAGRVTVGLAYKPTENEQTGSLFLVYSTDGKGAEWLYQSSYDKNSGNVVASTGHFSVYAVGYKPAPAFADTMNHWAKADIDFVASRGLLAGTGDTTFTPDGTTTRGMFVVALGRLAGINPAAYPSSRFTDVAATAYYAPYVEWAASKGIITGTGETAFSPDATITREQMAAIMQRYADKLGYILPVAREAEIFADEGQITSGMKDAVQAMQQAGVMNGKGGHRFGPKDTATRAEAAAVLRRFVEIVIDPAAAGGWGQNDAGKWLYYENNKPVTGWKQIDSTWYYFDAAGLMQAGGWREIGGKWYYFYPDGAMAVNTKIGGYEIGPDGARKE